MKKYYISFGQIHTHSVSGKTFDKDCLGELEAENREEAHEKAMEIFKGVFHNVYEELPDMIYFPRGVIKII